MWSLARALRDLYRVLAQVVQSSVLGMEEGFAFLDAELSSGDFLLLCAC
jgi:hypothetical protein